MKARPSYCQDGQIVGVVVLCPACRDHIDSGPRYANLDPSRGADHTWTWNGDTERPTIGGSFLRHGADGYVCHATLTDGAWTYHGDCTHGLVGQTVEAPDLPEWAGG